VRAAAAPRFGNQCLHDRAAGLETGRLLPFRTEKRIDGAVLTVEDVDLVMAIGLGEEYAELGVREVEINGLVRDLGDGIVPPGDGFLFVQHARDTMIESVLDERAFAFGRRLVGRPARIGNDREQDQAEEDNRRHNRFG
jgi:hypothetical protein